MIFYTDGIMVIRTMTEKDVPIIVSEETAQGWNADAKKHLRYCRTCCILTLSWILNSV